MQRDSAFHALQGVFRETCCPEFAVGGKARLPMPELFIEGVGEISLPLLPVQADAIKAVGEKAPYGKDSETIIDRSVRDSTQVDASHVKFLNPAWKSEINALSRTVCVALGINGHNVRAELYKVLLYEVGGHFKPHTDTEKTDGMFGTLIVQFPSRYTGGEFSARHQGITKVIDMGSADASCRSSYYYAAHYADCEHEIKEITSGIRLAAVYSLSWTKPTGLPAPPSTEPVNQLLHNLPLVGDVCLGVLLQHTYTHASLSALGLKALKGVDRNFAGTLLAASAALAQQSPPDELVLHIAKAIRAERSSHGVQTRPAVYFGHVFRADGTQRDRETVDLLNTFDMERHVLNELRRVGPPESTDGAEWEEEEYGIEEAPDWAHDGTPEAGAGWWHKIPCSSGYTGNQVQADAAQLPLLSPSLLPATLSAVSHNIPLSSLPIRIPICAPHVTSFW